MKYRQTLSKWSFDYNFRVVKESNRSVELSEVERAFRMYTDGAHLKQHFSNSLHYI